MEFDNVETIKRSVEVGRGLSILPASTVAREARSRALSIVEFAEGPFTREVGVIHRRGRLLSTPAQAFVHLLLGSEAPKRGRLIR
jgi:DNA-binding transcriptional LysR family regulator